MDNKLDVTAVAIGRRVMQARLRLGLERGAEMRAGDLARAAGVTAGAVSRIESGDKRPSYELVVRLAGALGVRAGWLAFGEGGDAKGGAEAPPAHPPAQPVPKGMFTPSPRRQSVTKRKAKGGGDEA